jgi:hypothetical protein
MRQNPIKCSFFRPKIGTNRDRQSFRILNLDVERLFSRSYGKSAVHSDNGNDVEEQESRERGDDWRGWELNRIAKISSHRQSHRKDFKQQESATIPGKERF